MIGNTAIRGHFRPWNGMLGRALAVLALALAFSIPAHIASAERRLALVIGNDDYLELEPLQKAVSDAETYADVLREKGFDDVSLHRNLTRSGMDAAIASFLGKLQPGDTALFAYSGHGWSDGSQNYIVATDAPRAGSTDLLSRISIPLRNGVTGVLDDIERRGAGLKIAIVDACRDNPFSGGPQGRSVGATRGLSRIEPPQGTFVVFSAGTGQAALDGLSNTDPDPNSVFTRVFAPLLRSGMTLREATLEARRKVVALASTVDHAQLPAYYDEALGDTCLTARCGDDGSADGTAGSQPERNPPVDGISQREAYELAREIDTVAAWDAFLEAFPEGLYGALARAARGKLQASLPPEEPAEEPEVVPTPEPETARETPPIGIPPSPADVLAIRNFVTSQILSGDLTNEARLRSAYADWVDYFDKGIVSVAVVVADKRAYGLRWSNIKYGLVPGTLAYEPVGGRSYRVEFDSNFQVSDGDRLITGVASNAYTIDMSSPSPRISAETSEVIRRNAVELSAVEPTPQPAPQTGSGLDASSYWNHNGSVMALVASGSRRAFHYETPRTGMVAAGARPGDLLFDGTTNGQTYVGTAHIFSRTCGTRAYQVSGSVSNGGTRVVLKGNAPKIAADCSISGYRADTLVFDYLSKTR